MPQNKNIIRVGDTVRVLNPLFFVRCGYPLDFNGACELVAERDKAKIEQCISILLDIKPQDMCQYNFDKFMSKASKRDRTLESDIIRALAYREVGLQYKTGAERKIYTVEYPHYKDKLFTVISKKCVKTGIYYSPSGGYDSYTGEYDYENGGLSYEKTHVILGLNEKSSMYMWGTTPFEIEKIHVEKIQSEV